MHVRPSVLGHLGAWESAAQLHVGLLVLVPIPTVVLNECVPAEDVHGDGILAERDFAAHVQPVPWVHDLTA